MDILYQLLSSATPPVIVTFVLLVGLFIASIKITREYERGVIFRRGRLRGAKGPGLFFIIPITDRMVKVDLRLMTLDVPIQEAITQDNIAIKVTGTVLFRVIDPVDAIVQVKDYCKATLDTSQAVLRNVLGQFTFSELLANQGQINQKLQQIIDERVEPWGVIVRVAEVKDIEVQDAARKGAQSEALQADALTRIQEELNHCVFLSRLSIGLLALVVGIAVIFLLPLVWPWLNQHPNRLGLMGSTTLIVCGISWAIVDLKRRRFALGSLALGALLVMMQIIGR